MPFLRLDLILKAEGRPGKDFSVCCNVKAGFEGYEVHHRVIVIIRSRVKT